MSLKFGLNLQKKNQNGFNKPAPGKRKPLLDEEDDDFESKGKDKVDGADEIGGVNFENNLLSTSGSNKPASSKTKTKPPGPPTLKSKSRLDDPSNDYTNLSSLAESKKKVDQVLEEDPSIYDYDAAYDAIHARNAAKEAAEREDALQRRPKYMNNLFESAEVRKRDQLRAKDKLLQREREAEGDEFADKEKFVTGAYKEQQAEVRRLEEEEKKRQEEEDKKRGKLGMQGFYRKMMEEDEKRHQEAMEAAAQAAKEGPKLQQNTERNKTDVDLANEMNAQGQNVIVNDEGQVADKRQLLGAGLNVVAKPKSAATTPASSRSSGPQHAYQGRTSTQRAVRERQSKMLEEQLEQAAKRAADDEAEQQRKLQHTSKSRKTQGDISSARERYLQRKKEAAAAAATKES